MTAEQAKYSLDSMLPVIEEEIRITRKVLAAIPEEKRDYRPHAKSRSAMEQAWHVVSSEIWFLNGIIHGEFAGEETRMPAHVKTIADIVKWYDGNIPGLIAQLRAMPASKLMQSIPFFGIMNDPAVSYLMMNVLHTVHHRGQVTTYLRCVDARVPSVYGGSADEPFQMPAESGR
jgi:uncharacterized damage-inducible protein DinB